MAVMGGHRRGPRTQHPPELDQTRIARGREPLPIPSFNPATCSAVRLCVETTAQQARAGLDEFLTISKETLGILGRRL